MGNLVNLIAGTVYFPETGAGWFPFIGKLAYILIDAMHAGGALHYGVAVILFTIILKLILTPLDFANRYFTKKNSAQMLKLKPEEDALKEQYAGDPVSLNRARQELYRKNGYKMGGFCLFNILNILLTLAIFMSVFLSLQAVANHNINLQFKNELQPIYLEYEKEHGDAFYAKNDEGAYINPELNAAFAEEVVAKYNETSVRFLWVGNIWKPDIGTSKTYDWSGFAGAARGAEQSVFGEIDPSTEKAWSEEKLQAQYETIFAAITPTQQGWNGWFILIALAGLVMYFSSVINFKMMSKKKDAGQPKEDIAQYSMRNVKNQADKPAVPAVDPAMMGKVMKYLLPITMIIFTFTSTAALALYIITNAIFSTLLTIGMNWPVDKLIEHQEKKKKARDEIMGTGTLDESIINPHAKYFKNKRKN